MAHRISAVACLLALLFVGQRRRAVEPTPARAGSCEAAVPEHTVDPVVSPMTYRGGTVIVRAAIDVRGDVTGVDVLKPFPALTEPAVKALRQWTFRPALENGRVVPSSTLVVMQMSLVRVVPPIAPRPPR